MKIEAYRIITENKKNREIENVGQWHKCPVPEHVANNIQFYNDAAQKTSQRIEIDLVELDRVDRYVWESCPPKRSKT
jgi:hypothetical protein